MGYERRIQVVQGKLREKGFGGALFSYSRDVYYLTGTAQPCHLVILPEDYLLFVRNGIRFVLEEVFIDRSRIIEERRLEKIHALVAGRFPIRCLGIGMDVLTGNQVEEIKGIFTGFEFRDVSPLLLDQRRTKEAREIECIREACAILQKGHEAVVSTLREGVTELELAAAVEYSHRLAGHEGTIFIRHPDFFMSTGPIASGPNLLRPSGALLSLTGVGLSSAVPAGPSRRRILKGDAVIVDIPTMVRGYHADQTRTYVVGKASRVMRESFDKLREISDTLIDSIRPGMRGDEVYGLALRKSEELGVSDSFLNLGNHWKVPLVGHGCGLEVNEPPYLSRSDRSIIGENQITTVEMHILREEFGAVKLEDMVLIGRNGNELLSVTERRLFEV